MVERREDQQEKKEERNKAAFLFYSIPLRYPRLAPHLSIHPHRPGNQELSKGRGSAFSFQAIPRQLANRPPVL